MGFLDRAKLLGHDVEALKRGEVINSTVTVNSIEDFKRIFTDDVDESQRKIFTKHFWEDRNEDIDVPVHLLMSNLMNHVYGDADMSQQDKEYAKKLFPVTVQAMSGQDVTINTDVVQGPQGAPYAINAGTLTFDGGSVTAITTSLTINADNLVLKAGGSKSYHVGVLGAQGAKGDDGKQGDDYTSAASNGSDASAPTPGICTGASDGGKGDDGDQGKTGGDGHVGADGLANLPANIAIKSFDASNASAFVVYTQSGAGGEGGTGGKGGTGQKGGNGGHGCDSGCEGTDGGKGGNGGKGGTGGKGGNGGNGVAGNTISITFPGASKSQLQTVSDPAPVGKKGSGGAGGDGGGKGSGGGGGKHKSNGSDGSDGQPGDKGADGDPGGKTGAPGNFSFNYT